MREATGFESRPGWCRAVAPLVVLLLLAVAFAPARADDESEARSLDRIHLKNGRVFAGRIQSEDAEGVTLRLPSETGGEGIMRFPMTMIERIERSADRAPMVGGSSSVRDAWYLLRSGGRTLGTRHLTLRHVRGEEEIGWRLEETVVYFARGTHVPATRIQRMERVDLAFHPRQIHYREVGEPSAEPGGLGRYERVLTGPVRDGVWEAIAGGGGAVQTQRVPVGVDMRSRLGTREHLLRSRETGLREVVFLEPSGPGRVTARAGYTALDVTDPDGTVYDEFVWEEDGLRLVSRFRNAEVIQELVGEGVVAVPASLAQADAAAAEARRGSREDDPNLIQLPAAGLAFELPGTSWTWERVEQTDSGTTGWRKLALLESRFHVASVRVEWDPGGAAFAPTEEEAAQRLLVRLRTACPDLRELSARAPVRGRSGAILGWRLDLIGTLKGDRIRTVAVVVDRGAGRVLLLAGCPEVSWPQAARSLEKLFTSLRTL